MNEMLSQLTGGQASDLFGPLGSPALNFYVDPAFFLLVACAVIPAIVCGLAQKRMRGYGLVISVVFIALLFGHDAAGFLALVGFLVWASVITQIVLRMRRRDQMRVAGAVVDDAHQASQASPTRGFLRAYRFALVLIALPLILAKIMGIFDTNLLGFVGISYITFKSAQVIIEIRDDLITELSVLDYLYFLLFFPVFTSGPITRSRDFVADISRALPRAEYTELLASGALKFVRGVFYTFFLAAFLQWARWFYPSAIGDATFGLACARELTEALLYGLHLFFDFAGYSLMAQGIGAAFGVRVPDNFRAPFLSVDIKDFWNRWHLTLSYWLRDYVFMRMMRGFIKAKTFSSRTNAACAAFMVQMTLMGAWHGLNASMIAYGVYHGVLMSLCELYQKKSQFYKKHKRARWYRVVSWVINMIAVFLGFSIFSGQVERIIRALFV